MAWVVPQGFSRPVGTEKPAGSWSIVWKAKPTSMRPANLAAMRSRKSFSKSGRMMKTTLPKPAERVEYGVVEDGLAGWTHRVDLLQAAVAATHAGGKYEEGGLHVRGICGGAR